jgi:hypothetical protein
VPIRLIATAGREKGISMTHNVTINRQGDHLHIIFSGSFSLAASKASVDAMVKACAEGRCSKVLFDCRPMTGEMSIMDRFDTGQYGAQTITHGIKIAMLAREDQISPNNFFENVAVNRGVNLKVFTDENGAIEWLRA